MRATAIVCAVLLLATRATAAQPLPKIQVAIEAEGTGPAANDAAARLGEELRKGLAAAGDVEIVSRVDARRVIRIIVSVVDGVYGASLLVTEQYDRPTLMVLGIEDDDLAGRMMMLQIVNEHQGFAGRDLADIGRRMTATLDDGLFKSLRALRR
jgi:hypothetical protein